MYRKYGELAQFFVVYIKEAHPERQWEGTLSARVRYTKDPETIFERFQIASTCVANLDISIPCLIDDMENTAARAYKAHPDRLYVVGKDGKIAYHGGPGPYGFTPHQMEEYLLKEFERIGVHPPGSK